MQSEIVPWSHRSPPRLPTPPGSSRSTPARTSDRSAHSSQVSSAPKCTLHCGYAARQTIGPSGCTDCRRSGSTSAVPCVAKAALAYLQQQCRPLCARRRRQRMQNLKTDSTLLPLSLAAQTHATTQLGQLWPSCVCVCCLRPRPCLRKAKRIDANR